jgi:hypothetical protein
MSPGMPRSTHPAAKANPVDRAMARRPGPAPPGPGGERDGDEEQEEGGRVGEGASQERLEQDRDGLRIAMRLSWS